MQNPFLSNLSNANRMGDMYMQLKIDDIMVPGTRIICVPVLYDDICRTSDRLVTA